MRQDKEEQENLSSSDVSSNTQIAGAGADAVSSVDAGGAAAAAKKAAAKEAAAKVAAEAAAKRAARAAKDRSCVALDGTGGDHRDTRAVVDAARFAMAMYPQLDLIIFGSSQLEQDLLKAGIKKERYEFRLAQQTIPQDEPPRLVLKNYQHAAMVQALACVRDGEADSMISSGGTGPLVTLARHMLGVQHLSPKRTAVKAKIAQELGYSPAQVRASGELGGSTKEGAAVRPCFAARIPVGPNRFALMLDLGANASCQPWDLYDFACLGHACARVSLEIDSPRISLLNVGTELGKGNHFVHQARDFMAADRSLQFTGFIEGNRIFRDDADVIVTDGFTGNVALKAAEGVADIYASAGGMKKFFGKLARPEWLLPWQYNGSVLLGVNGLVIKSHASAGIEALAVAVVEAARAAHSDLATNMQQQLLRE